MQKFTAQLTFDNQAEEAVKFYLSIFQRSKILRMDRFSEKEIAALSRLSEDVRPGPAGSVNLIKFQLAGQEFFAVNGGPYFKFSPAISFLVNCESAPEIELLFEKLSADGMVLMPLDQYPMGEKFGWVQDKFGVSWQLNLTNTPQKITPFLMFVGEQHGKAEEAINFYTSLFEDSAIKNIARYGKDDMEPEGSVKHATFQLSGQEFMAMDSNRAHPFTFTAGISIYVSCETQAEIDRLWEELSEGGDTQDCGWLHDKYGVVWQIAPAIVDKMFSDPDPEKVQRVKIAILNSNKLDIKTLQEAYQQG